MDFDTTKSFFSFLTSIDFVMSLFIAYIFSFPSVWAPNLKSLIYIDSFWLITSESTMRPFLLSGTFTIFCQKQHTVFLVEIYRIKVHYLFIKYSGCFFIQLNSNVSSKIKNKILGRPRLHQFKIIALLTLNLLHRIFLLLWLIRVFQFNLFLF